MKTRVYSWRLSSELKSDMEREARVRKLSVSSLLDRAVREYLQRSTEEIADDALQKQRHAQIEQFLGVLDNASLPRSENVRQGVRKRLRARNRAAKRSD